MEEKETTHKRISYRNIDRIKKIGEFGESFDMVLSRVLDYWDDGHQEI